MADRKISALSAVTTVGDTDEYVVAVSGATKKITGANLKAAVAPKAGTYITQVAESGLSAEQDLASLATGILKNTTTTGVLSIAAGSDLPTGIPIAKLADPTTGKVIGSVSNAAAAVYPPGYQFDYAENATTVSTTQTTQASAVTLIAGNAVTYDGSTTIMIHFYCGYMDNTSSSTRVTIWEDSTDLGVVIRMFSGAGDGFAQNAWLKRTPSAGSHTYTAKMFVGGGTGSAYGSSQSVLPMFIRVTKI